MSAGGAAHRGLAYLDADQLAQRPVMIHRSIVGSLERVVAHLIDTHQGAFPAWLAPTQVVVLPVTDDHLPAAHALLGQLLDLDLRAELAAPDRGTLGARIRAHHRAPYLAVIGDREINDNMVSLRLRGGAQLDPLPNRQALERINGAIRTRSHQL